MYFEEFTLGMTREIPAAPVEQEEMLTFANRWARQRVHIDEEYAKTTRFGRLLAPGIMSFLVVWAKFYEDDLFGEQLIAGRKMSIEWMGPVFAGDVLTGKVTVTGLTRRNAYNGIVETTIEAYNQNGELVLTNVSESVVKCRDTE